MREALSCPVCGNSAENRTHPAREMFLGTRDPFTYAECAKCGALWLLNPPDLARYYQHDDYLPLEPADFHELGRWERSIRALLTDIALLGVPLAVLRRDDRGSHWSQLLRAARARRTSAILDVGSGNASFLRQLHRHGFGDLTGIDPFLDPQLSIDGIRLERTTLDEFRPGRRFDVVFLNDVFEHVPDPSQTLRDTARLLSPSGTAVIRTPVADSHAWRTYQANWFSLDPPRHLVIQTRRSMEILAGNAGLRIKQVIFDAGSQQFANSELYVKDIPFNDRSKPIAAQSQMDAWERRAAELNALQEGDHASFLLSH